MTRRVVWAKVARRDLDAILSYLADRNDQAALSALDRIEARAASLSTLAERGRVVPEMSRIHVRHYRELVVPPYRIVYRLRGSVVLVLAVVDGRRSLEDLLLDRLIGFDAQGA